jgi:apolipoprotein N-acyltransferase
LTTAPKKNLLLALVAFAASVVLLTVIQLPFGLSFLAWVAYVPLILIVLSNTKTSYLVLASYIVAFVYWLGNIYWMGYVTVSGWIAFCAYTALLWPVLVLTLRFCREKKIPLLIAVPVLIVGIEHLQGFLLGGFDWRYLAHSQYANITIIQIADIFGAAGISFLVAAVNAFVAEFILALRDEKLVKTFFFIKWAVILCALGATTLYGRYRISQSDQMFERGPIVAAVQSNLPQSVKSSGQFDVNREVFERLLAISRVAAAAQARLVVWPETIIPSVLDKPFWQFLVDPNENEFFDNGLSDFARGGVYLLVGSPGAIATVEPDGTISVEKYNSAFLYEPPGRQAPVKYNKIHLVPFGEVVPFQQSMPWLYDILMKFSPYDFDYNLTPGTQFTVFDMKGAPDERQYHFGVMICYEDAVPLIARRFGLDETGAKQVDWLVNISNDGWFVKFKNGAVRPSTELPQHAIACVFRAVENRLSIIRSVNTGISCLVDPLGRIQNSYLAGDLPQRALARAGMEGYFADRIVIDSRVTFFSRFGQWLDAGCAIAVWAVLILLLLRPVIRHISKKAEANAQTNPPK